MAQKLSIFSGQQFLDASGDPYVGAKLFTYVAGGSTKTTTTKDLAGLSAHSNPIILTSRGDPGDGSGASQAIWQTEGVSVKYVLAPAGDTDPPTSPISTWDNIAGINDNIAAAQDQWISGPTPTFVNATSFSLVGDQTSDFHVGRRLKTINSGGTIYSTIITTAYTSLTTVTVVNDSGSLDSGISAVSYGLLTATNTSDPAGTKYGDITFNDDVTFSSIAKLAKGADIASATALTVGTDGNYFDVTGTTTITSINTVGVGTVIKLHFDGVLTLTHHATNLDLQGGVDITTVAGDEMEFIEYASGQWRQTNYSPFINIPLNEGQAIIKQQDNLGFEGWSPRGYISGLVMSIGTDTDHDIDVTVGEATDSGADHLLKLTAAATVEIDAAFAVGNGGLSSSLTVANSTWYHYFIVKIGTAACKIGIDTSLTAANLVTDHSVTEYRRIGSALTNGSANLIGFAAYEISGGGLNVLWNSPVEDVDVVDQSTTAVARTLTVPTGLSVEAMLNVQVADNTSTTNKRVYLRNPDTTDLAPSITAAPYATSQGIGNTAPTVSGPHMIRTNTSAQIESRSDGATTELGIATLGWNEKR